MRTPHSSPRSFHARGRERGGGGRAQEQSGQEARDGGRERPFFRVEGPESRLANQTEANTLSQNGSQIKSRSKVPKENNSFKRRKNVAVDRTRFLVYNKVKSFIYINHLNYISFCRTTTAELALHIHPFSLICEYFT